jgi:hypothetical protein
MRFSEEGKAGQRAREVGREAGRMDAIEPQARGRDKSVGNGLQGVESRFQIFFADVQVDA